MLTCVGVGIALGLLSLLIPHWRAILFIPMPGQTDRAAKRTGVILVLLAMTLFSVAIGQPLAYYIGSFQPGHWVLERTYTLIAMQYGGQVGWVSNERHVGGIANHGFQNVLRAEASGIVRDISVRSENVSKGNVSIGICQDHEYVHNKGWFWLTSDPMVVKVIVPDTTPFPFWFPRPQ
jgi:hypothetical protein